MRPSTHIRSAGVVVLLLLSLSHIARGAELREQSVTIGHGWALVQETRGVRLTRGEHEILLHNIPAEADLSSLVLRSKRIPVHLKSWEWGGADAVDVVDSLVVDDVANEVSWAPRQRRSPGMPRALRSVRCLMSSPVSGPRDLELSYLVPGMDWQAHYQVLVRGWSAGKDEKLAVDISGSVAISNRTPIAFRQARVRLVGVDKPDLDSPPGLLILDPESPLADLWKDKPAEPSPEYVYALPNAVDLPAGIPCAVPFLNAQRVPASRRYVMRSSEFPLTEVRRSKALPMFIVIRNAHENGLGVALPFGGVDVFPGGMRQYMVPGAFIPHTAPNAEIRIAMGPSPDVFGGRHAQGRQTSDNNTYESKYELALKNERRGKALIEIEERPPPILKWDLISATAPLTETGNRLLFNITLPGNSERSVLYRVRVEEPRF